MRYVLASSLAATLFAGCGGMQPPGATPESHAVAQARGSVQRIRSTHSSYQVLYSFTGKSDGANPEASLIDVNGVLYGTTVGGGRFHRDGTAFRISTSGMQHLLHSFGRGRTRDGQSPVASLIDLGDSLYGTTAWGGAHRDGTVFSVSMSGRERVLHSFDYNSSSNSDGAAPFASLINVNGTLYGTTYYGGIPYFDFGGGTVFSISTNGNETVLHRFTGGKTDGAGPLASLIDVSGTLYGTTADDGAYGYLGGTVFSITTSGAEKILHSFGAPGDGDYPQASLIDVKGTLYGTTLVGGAYGGCEFGTETLRCGTVFSISTSGAEKVLHSFGNGSDGKSPHASLIDVKGTLYGTTMLGGTYGDGTVFSISTSGTEQVLHSFEGAPDDGKNPEAAMIEVNGTLYGTTRAGGATGHGTVFALTP
jgi:uncharacterized repeat protein (TIGR03803 family)